MGGMANHVYEMIEVVGSSPVSMEDAVKNAVAKSPPGTRACGGSRLSRRARKSTTTRSPTGR